MARLCRPAFRVKSRQVPGRVVPARARLVQGPGPGRRPAVTVTVGSTEPGRLGGTVPARRRASCRHAASRIMITAGIQVPNPGPADKRSVALNHNLNLECQCAAWPGSASHGHGLRSRWPPAAGRRDLLRRLFKGPSSSSRYGSGSGLKVVRSP